MAGPLIHSVLAELFSAMLITGYVPDLFKTGTIVPILKKGKDPLDPSSYRGITITAVLGKVLENIILQRRMPSAIQNKLQYGFTKGTSPSMAELLCTEATADALDDRRQVFLTALDSRKAFDVVDHQSLQLKAFKQCPDPFLWIAETALLDGLSASI